MSAFVEQLALLIIDKVLLALIVVLGAYLLNRRLEEFKTQQALKAREVQRRRDIEVEALSKISRMEFLWSKYALAVIHLQVGGSTSPGEIREQLSELRESVATESLDVCSFFVENQLSLPEGASELASRYIGELGKWSEEVVHDRIPSAASIKEGSDLIRQQLFDLIQYAKRV